MSKILVIEDEYSIRSNILDLLDLVGFEVIGAEDGLIGLALARQHQPDLILCDVMMPNLDGYGVLTALRQDSATAMIPFIFLTALASSSKGMELGANDYLTKPCLPEQLLKAITNQLENYKTSDRNINLHQ